MGAAAEAAVVVVVAVDDDGDWDASDVTAVDEA